MPLTEYTKFTNLFEILLNEINKFNVYNSCFKILTKLQLTIIVYVLIKYNIRGIEKCNGYKKYIVLQIVHESVDKRLDENWKFINIHRYIQTDDRIIIM